MEVVSLTSTESKDILQIYRCLVNYQYDIKKVLKQLDKFINKEKYNIYDYKELFDEINTLELTLNLSELKKAINKEYKDKVFKDTLNMLRHQARQVRKFKSDRKELQKLLDDGLAGKKTSYFAGRIDFAIHRISIARHNIKYIKNRIKLYLKEGVEDIWT